MQRNIIHDEKWIRFVKENGMYKVQVKYWFRWRDVSFGPYAPNTVGTSSFSTRRIAEFLFIRCLFEGKSYTLNGVSK